MPKSSPGAAEGRLDVWQGESRVPVVRRLGGPCFRLDRREPCLRPVRHCTYRAICGNRALLVAARRPSCRARPIAFLGSVLCTAGHAATPRSVGRANVGKLIEFENGTGCHSRRGRRRGASPGRTDTGTGLFIGEASRTLASAGRTRVRPLLAAKSRYVMKRELPPNWLWFGPRPLHQLAHGGKQPSPFPASRSRLLSFRETTFPPAARGWRRRPPRERPTCRCAGGPAHAEDHAPTNRKSRHAPISLVSHRNGTYGARARHVKRTRLLSRCCSVERARTTP